MVVDFTPFNAGSILLSMQYLSKLLKACKGDYVGGLPVPGLWLSQEAPETDLTLILWQLVLNTNNLLKHAMCYLCDK